MKKKTLFITLALIILGAALGKAFESSVHFSEMYTMKIAPFFRVPLSFIFSLFPFSVFESIILVLSIMVVALILSLVKKLIFKGRTSHYKVYLKIIYFSLVFIFSAFILTFKSTYTRVSIDEHLNLEMREMNENNILLALDVIIEECNELETQISHTPYTPTSFNMTFKEMSRKVLKAADKAAEKYSFLQKNGAIAKPIAFSQPLAYTGISGIYGFFTGEANINTKFAPYSIPFTIAHEYSHQRGIGPEKEAEFSAFLICMESDEPYVRYSAYSQAAITLSNLLFEYNENMFYYALERFPDMLYNDIYHSSKTYEEYSKTALDEIASSINNVYLLSNSDEGVISYSLSAQLYVAYLLK